jgi:hypothetical protein
MNEVMTLEALAGVSLAQLDPATLPTLTHSELFHVHEDSKTQT